MARQIQELMPQHIHVTTTPVYARDTGERRCLPLSKALAQTYARPALRKAFAAFAADSKAA
jgi:hypothetical protein